jgi:Flp pilus assembly protein TadG
MAALIKILRRWRCDSGAEFVEAALAMPLLLLVVFGIMDFGLMFQQYEVLTNAAREGARIAVLPTYQGASLQANVQNRVQQYINASFLASGGSPTVAPVVVTSGVAVGGGSTCTMTTYKVTVTYPHQFLFLAGIGNYFGTTFGTKTLTASSTMRSEIPGTGC